MAAANIGQNLELPPQIDIRYDQLSAGMAKHGMRLATPEETALGLDLAADLLGGELAPAHIVVENGKYTNCGAWVFGTPVEGVILFMPLSKTGHEALQNNTFNPASGDLSHACKSGEKCAGVYVGVYAGATRQARGAVMRASADLRVEIFGAVPCYARAASEDGARSMKTLAFHPAGFGLPDLWMQEPLFQVGSKAA